MSRPGIDRVFERRLAALVNGGEPQVLQGGAKGVEKESLRVLPDGNLAHTAHPRALGSALTNEHITTDYSEALIELVTPAFPHSWELLQYLLDLHQFVYRHLGEELLWATSMPCAIASDAEIPLAQYGSSHVGRMKTVYRNGLGLRYGRMMQAISGVHFNYSFPLRFWEAWAAARGASGHGQPFVSGCYFDLLRNYRRYGWLVLYLFGVSPVVCKSFLRGRRFGLDDFGAGTAFAPYATSLRMSDVGYRNRNQAGLSVSVNSLEQYVHDLTRAITTPHPPYAALGVEVDGEWRQLNANIPADRERVLQLHPPEARGALRRASHQGAAPCRRRVRRGARARCERLRSGGRQSEQAALPRGVSRAVLDEGERTDRARRAGRPR